jgi:hypothetical protein
MGDEEPVTQQQPADPPEEDTGAPATEATQDTSATDGGVKPAETLTPPKYKP